MKYLRDEYKPDEQIDALVSVLRNIDCRLPVEEDLYLYYKEIQRERRLNFIDRVIMKD